MSGWVKSSRCGDSAACAEVASWRKSSASGPSNCVEAGHGPGIVGVRDSADLSGPVLEFSPAAWTAFAERLKAG